MHPLDIFLHIPKTAGTTIRHILKREYGDDDSAVFLSGSRPFADFERLRSRTDKDKIRFVMGHIDIGIGDIFPGRDIRFFTVFRDPVERVISHYHFVRRKSNHYLHRQVVEKGVSLSNYLESGYTNELDNGQVRMLIKAGGFSHNHYTERNIPYGEVKECHLQEALEILEGKIYTFGVQSMFDLSVLNFRRKLGWRTNPYYPDLNVGNWRQRETVSNSDLDTIKHYNAYDIALYNRALSLFLERGQTTAEHLLDSFQYRNKLYNKALIAVNAGRKLLLKFRG